MLCKYLIPTLLKYSNWKQCKWRLNGVLKIIKQKSKTNKYKSKMVVKFKRVTRCILEGTLYYNKRMIQMRFSYDAHSNCISIPPPLVTESFLRTSEDPFTCQNKILISTKIICALYMIIIKLSKYLLFIQLLQMFTVSKN